MYKDYFFFDIETTSKKPTLMDLKLDDPYGAELFIKKCEKLKKYPNSEWVDIPCEDLYIEKSSILPEFGKIICMSFGMFSDDQKHVMTIIEEDEEKLMQRIAKVFTRAGKRRLCGFNIKSFDIPWIVRKLYKYNIDIPSNINFYGVKPWEMNIVDLLETWKGTGKYNMTLEEIAYDIGIENPKKLMSGNEVHEYYWFKKDIKSIMNYCESDINCIIQIADKLKM